LETIILLIYIFFQRNKSILSDCDEHHITFLILEKKSLREEIEYALKICLISQMGCTITVSSRKTHEIIKSNLATEKNCDLQSVRKEKLTPRNWTSVVKAGGIGGGGGVCFF
jgi:hypothetical protein